MIRLDRWEKRMEASFDLVIKNARVVRPNRTSVDCLDIAVADGRIALLAPEIRPEQARETFDAKNLSGVSRARRLRTCTPASIRRSRRTR